MLVGTLEIKLYASWVNSLKGKRMILQRLISKIKNTFNVSVAEVDMQDNHKILVIGIASVTNDSSHLDSILDNIISFVEENSEARILSIERELR
ncbi:DUF503 domain-containing protein [Selenomonadales bacterium OttesenSCG-928-I06]|nr:DUF503 domain-containing protein [Selenomonadales bacterium OttesenSCG-928-I06]